MENSARTARYASLTAERRREVRDFFMAIAPNAGAKIAWEIGCGHGHFLTAFAQAHPERLCVGIDISSDRIARALRKRDRAQLPNLHFLQAEAMLALQEMPLTVSIATLFILFPDPWPKLRHQKHRILRPAFLQAAAARATTDCRLYFRTDYLPYFREAAALIQADSSWQITADPWTFEFETVFQQRALIHYSLVGARRA